MELLSDLVGLISLIKCGSVLSLSLSLSLWRLSFHCRAFAAPFSPVAAAGGHMYIGYVTGVESDLFLVLSRFSLPSKACFLFRPLLLCLLLKFFDLLCESFACCCL